VHGTIELGEHSPPDGGLGHGGLYPTAVETAAGVGADHGGV
jgi:hypothetical protein